MEPDPGIDPQEGRGLEKPLKGLLLLAAYGFALVIIIGGGMIHKKFVAEQSATATDGAIPYAAPPEPMEPAARTVLEAFFEAPDLSSKVAIVRDGKRVRPMMEDYHEERGHAFPTLGSVSPGKPAEFDGKPMVMFEVEPFSGPRYFVAVVWNGSRFEVDWESLTAYGTMDWLEFVEAKPAGMEILRVFLSQAGDDDRLPGSRAETVFFRIEHRDDPQPLIVAATGELAIELVKQTDGRRSPVTLKIEWDRSGASTAPMPWIRELVSEGWSP